MKSTESTTIKTKSARLTNCCCNYLRKRGYNTTISQRQDGYAITIYGLNSETAHKLVSTLIKKIRLAKQNSQMKAQKVA